MSTTVFDYDELELTRVLEVAGFSELDELELELDELELDELELARVLEAVGFLELDELELDESEAPCFAVNSANASGSCGA